MSISYQIHRDEGILVARLPARTTLQDLTDYVAATLADPAYTPGLVEIIDVTALAEPEAASSTFDAARLLTNLLPSPRVRARAIVAPTALLTGLARHYRNETVDAGVVTRVFRDLASATKWAHRLANGPDRAPPRS
jgi:hypothetical protein